MAYKDTEKQKEYQRDWYRKNVNVAERSREVRKKRREWLDSLKTGPCVDCGNNFPPCAKDFHHLDKSAKFMSVSTALSKWSKARILEEIKKCELVCSNCHRVREYGV